MRLKHPTTLLPIVAMTLMILTFATLEMMEYLHMFLLLIVLVGNFHKLQLVPSWDAFHLQRVSLPSQPFLEVFRHSVDQGCFPIHLFFTLSRSKESSSLVKAFFHPSISSWRSFVEHVVVWRASSSFTHCVWRFDPSWKICWHLLFQQFCLLDLWKTTKATEILPNLLKIPTSPRQENNVAFLEKDNFWTQWNGLGGFVQTD